MANRELLLITGQIVAGYLDLVRRAQDEDEPIRLDPKPTHFLTHAQDAPARSKKRAKKGKVRPLAKNPRARHECLLCGEMSGLMTVHLRHKHKMTPQEYVKQFGDKATKQVATAMRKAA